MPDEVRHPELAGDLDGPVGRAVVDHQDHDLVDALDTARDRLQDEGKRLLLVQAGDLHDELHGTSFEWRPAFGF